MENLLLVLFKKNAHKKPVKVSTTQLADICGMSQQNASKRLIVLEEEGVIRRSNKGIEITEKGEHVGKGEYLELKRIFEGGKIRIRGKVIQGSKQGRYYLSMQHYREEIKKILGVYPYPGTINIRIRKAEIPKREAIMKKDLIAVSGFRTRERTFGELFVYPARINGNKALVVFPLRTHYGKDIIEVVSGKRITGIKDKEVILEIE